jgi:hypothetical protein
MILILIKGANTFTVDKEYLEFLTLILSFKSIAPDPKSLGAWINSWTYTKTLVSFIDNNSIEKERFPCSVFPCH